MRHVSTIVALVIVAGGLSCGRDIVAPVAGTLRVQLTTPNSGADSAMVLTISGPQSGITGATPGPGLLMFNQPVGGTVTKFALVGQLNNGATLVTIGVPDVGRVSQYTASVYQVAAPDYSLRPSLAGYALSVTP